MSLNTLSKEFLDFGSSLWRSNRLSGEFPNLIRTPFAATGRYGIGFFSVFMWASQVKVVSRKFTAQDPTYVLEFEGGTAVRPIIRQATDVEILIGGGTAVSLWIKTPMIRSLFEEPDDVVQLCRWLCPAIDFDLFIRDGNQDKSVIRASDWLRLSGRELLERVIPIGSSLAQGESTDHMISAIRAISDDSGAIAGRASILDTRPYNDGTVSAAMGVITIGGFRANSLRGICGIVTGEPTTASRLSGRPAAPSEVFSRWATAQAQLLMSSTFSERILNASAAVVREWGGDVLELPLGNSAHGWLRKTDHDKWRLFPNEVSVMAIAMMHTVPDVDHDSLDGHDVDDDEDGYYGSHTMTIGSTALFSAVGQTTRFFPFLTETFLDRLRRTLIIEIIECLACAWGTTIEEVIEKSSIDLRELRCSYRDNGDPDTMYYMPTIQLRNPKTA